MPVIGCERAARDENNVEAPEEMSTTGNISLDYIAPIKHWVIHIALVYIFQQGFSQALSFFTYSVI